MSLSAPVGFYTSVWEKQPYLVLDNTTINSSTVAGMMGKNSTAAVTGVTSNADFEMTSVGLGDDTGVVAPAGGGGIGVEHGYSGYWNGNNGNGSGAGITAEERAEKYPVGNSSAAGAVSNFVNTIVGAGIVGLPFALAQVGGILMFALSRGSF